ncbi:MAG: ion transporter, partial [Maioricimonas sp. JB049]
VVSFTVETLPRLPAPLRSWLSYVELALVSAFSAEYLLRVAVAQRKLRFVFSFFGMIDLLAILPGLLALGVDLRSLRAFRLLRVFRTLKLVRYNRAIARFHRAIGIAREEIVLFLCATSILLYLSAVGIYFFEHDAQPEVFASVFHSLWWAVATFTTVGYGDIYPVTAGGRIFTSIMLFVGLGIVSVPAGLVASALSKARDMDE